MDAASSSGSDALRRFLSSTRIDYEKWHDGIGYDLDALKQLRGLELNSVERMLIERTPRDWRDVEALGHIGSPGARRAIAESLTSSDNRVRQYAQRYAARQAEPSERERLLVRSLEQDEFYDGLTQALDEVPDFHPPGVIDALFRGTLMREGEVAVHFAAMLMFLHGKATEPFDWGQRPFFLRFHTDDRAERASMFRKLCEKVGIDPARYAT